MSALPAKSDLSSVIGVSARARPTDKAFAPWSKVEEQQVRKEYEEGLSVTQIAKEHKRSPRAIELRLQRLGVIAPD
jgi:hypothetical protein